MSTEKSQNRCVYKPLKGSVTAEMPIGWENPHVNTNERLMRILSDDFATVDLREEPCNNSLPEKQNSRRRTKRKTATKNARRGEGKATICKRVSANVASSPRVWCICSLVEAMAAVELFSLLELFVK